MRKSVSSLTGSCVMGRSVTQYALVIFNKKSYLFLRSSSITLISFGPRKSLKRGNGTSRNLTTRNGTSRSCKALLGPRTSLKSSGDQPRNGPGGNSFGRRSLVDRTNFSSCSAKERPHFSCSSKKNRFNAEMQSFIAETEHLNSRAVETEDTQLNGNQADCMDFQKMKPECTKLIEKDIEILDMESNECINGKTF